MLIYSSNVIKNEILMLFNVFGRMLQIEKFQNEWRVYHPSNDGKRRPSSLVIPEFIQDEELIQYLTDIFHENVSPQHPEVLKVR